MNISNVVIETFHKGGPIMWPILVASLVGVTVVAERALWWLRLRLRSRPTLRQVVLEELAAGRLRQAVAITEKSRDPVIQVIHEGLLRQATSLETSLQIAATRQLHLAGRNLGVLDTIITLGPLLGLLGTVTGIMGAFNFVGNEEVAAVKVSGGIAEALIATAAGLGIAIFNLLPFNYFHSRINGYSHLLQTVVGEVEVLLLASRGNGHQILRKETPAPSRKRHSGIHSPFFSPSAGR